MANPWTRKNPALSAFLSGANAWAGAARGLWTKEARRQQGAAMASGAKQVAKLWTTALAGSVSGAKRRKPRR